MTQSSDLDNGAPEAAASARILHGMEEISAERWDSCWAQHPYNPFLTHKFLHALEQSGSVTPRTGWQPLHLMVEQADKLTSFFC